jgi:hypothetical protein
MGKDKRDIYREALNFHADVAGSIPVTRSRTFYA